LFHTSNYSIGVNILFAVNEYLARLMNRFPEYNVGLEETHHIHKLDAPSGTAVTIAQQIIKEIDPKTEWVLGEECKPNQIAIKVVREGEVTGTHEITYDSDVDYIKLKHFARSRKGFAMGAVLAAEFIAGKKGVFTMRDVLGI
jgi:4-hydroxy-tetrahydrodipicolinate reductase